MIALVKNASSRIVKQGRAVQRLERISGLDHFQVLFAEIESDRCGSNRNAYHCRLQTSADLHHEPERDGINAALFLGIGGEVAAGFRHFGNDDAKIGSACVEGKHEQKGAGVFLAGFNISRVVTAWRHAPP
jgi:hypothetical protein